MKNIFFAVGFFLTLLLIWPFFIAPTFTYHDDVQIIRLHQMNKCFEDLQIPCRWVPDLGGEYGYPLFNYYAPLPYYFGEIFYLLTKSLFISVKVMFITSFVGAFIFMYLLARRIWGDMGGALAGVFYSYAPYHGVDMYVRGAMGELWGLMFMPAILWGVLRIKEKPNLKNAMLLGILVAGLMISHNLTALIFIPIVLLFMFTLYIHHKKFAFVKYSSLGFFLALLLSAFYFFPVVAEKELVHVETTTFGYFSYTEHFKGLRKLFFDYSWGWGASVREVPGGEKDDISFQIGIVHVGFWILGLIGLYKLWRKNSGKSFIVIFSSLVILGSVLMIHPRSSFIWEIVEPLKYLQFPWRFLMFIILFISLLAPAALYASEREKYKRIIWIGGLILVVIANFWFFRPERFIDISENELLTGEHWDKQIKRSIFDYLPKTAKEPPAELATQRYVILTGDSEISNFEEKSNEIKFTADTKTHTILRLSQYYFPNWRIYDYGEELKVDYDNTLGLMTIILGVGQHEIHAKLFDTPVRILGNTLTILGVFSYLILGLFAFEKSKAWLRYYLKALKH